MEAMHKNPRYVPGFFKHSPNASVGLSRGGGVTGISSGIPSLVAEWNVTHL